MTDLIHDLARAMVHAALIGATVSVEELSCT